MSNYDITEEKFLRLVSDPAISLSFEALIDAFEEEQGTGKNLGEFVAWLQEQPPTFESMAIYEMFRWVHKPEEGQ